VVKILFILISVGAGIGTSFLFSSFGPLYQTLIAIGLIFAYMLAIFCFFFIQFFFEVFFESKKKKRKYQSKYFRKLLNMYDLFLFSLFGMKITFSGKELLKKGETYMLVCNHRSNMDSLVIDYYLRDIPLAFVTKHSLFKVPFVGKLIHGCAYISMNRNEIRSQYNAINEAIEYVGRNDRPISIGIFPEGKRGKNDDGLPNCFKPGCFQIAVKNKKPIIVSAIKGTKKINNKLLLKKHLIQYDIIKIVEYSEYQNMTTKELADYCNNIIKEHLKEN